MVARSVRFSCKLDGRRHAVDRCGCWALGSDTPDSAVAWRNAATLAARARGLAAPGPEISGLRNGSRRRLDLSDHYFSRTSRLKLTPSCMRGCAAYPMRVA